MDSKPKRSLTWSLWALIVVVALSVLGGGWWTYRFLNPAKFPEQAGIKVEPKAEELRISEPLPDEGIASVPLIGEMDELGEPRIPPVFDLTNEVFGTLRTSEAGLPLQKDGLSDEDYRLTDDDYVPKAMERGFLILPAAQTVEPASATIPHESR